MLARYQLDWFGSKTTTSRGFRRESEGRETMCLKCVYGLWLGRKNAGDNRGQSLTAVLSTTDRRSVNYSTGGEGGVGLFGREQFPLRKHFQGLSEELFTTIIFFLSPLTHVARPTRMQVPISLTGTAHAQRLRLLVIRFHFQNRFLPSNVYTYIYKRKARVHGFRPVSVFVCNAYTSGSINRD